MKDKLSDQNKAVKSRIWITRILIFIVFTLNVTCAIQFLRQPASFAPSFDLSSEAGIMVIQSLGVLFLMWNVPYAIAIIHPDRYYVALVSAVIMQSIGVLGESWIYFQIQSLILSKLSILRFIWFDTAGFFLLLIAMLLIVRERKNG
jgi:hypothetical protein